MRMNQTFCIVRCPNCECGFDYEDIFYYKFCPECELRLDLIRFLWRLKE